MDISLVIPAHNEEGFIGPCLDSVLKNAPGKFKQIIVVDNTSTDGTAKEAGARPGVRVVYEPNKGLTHARQKGLEESSGEFLAFIDADERMPEGWFEKAEYYFSKYPEAVVLSGPVRYYDSGFFAKWLIIIGPWILYPLAFLIGGHWVLGGNFIVRRSALLAIGGFDTSVTFYGEDANLGRRLAKVGRSIFKMDFTVYTSARRLKAEGTIRLHTRYILSFLTQSILHRSHTSKYTDVRT